MRFRGSRIIEVEEQWKPRRIRRNRKWRGPRKMKPMPTKIVKLLEDDVDFNGRNSPCSVVSFTLSLDNRIEDSHEDNGWIRTAHIKNPAVNENNRRSPLFTGRMLRRNELLDEIGDCGSRQELSNEYPSEVERNLNTDRPSIRERLEPRQVCTERSGFNAPQHLESPEIDMHHDLESSYIDIQRCMENPMIIRIKDSIPSEKLPFHQKQQPNKPTSHQNARFIREDYDAYNGDRFSRNQFLLVRGPRCFRQSLYYPPGHSSPFKEGSVRQQRSRGTWLKTSADSSNNSQAYADHYNRRDGVDYNVERFSRETYLHHDQRPYVQSEYSRQKYLDHRNDMRESRSEMSFSCHEVRNYCDCRTEAFEMSYNDRRDDGRFDRPYSPDDSYGPSFSPRGFSSSGPSPYSSDSLYPPRDSAMDTTWYKSGMESTTMANWDGSNYNYSYQDRISDEDFTDSDQIDSEVESSDINKKEVRQMWKNLTKERAILVHRVGDSAAMTREWGHYVKKILLERASDPTKFQGNWKPRFLRTGLVHRTGLYQIICGDHQTMLWTMKQDIPPLDNVGFKILKRPYDWDCGPVSISMWLHMEPFNLQEALERIGAENPGVGVSNWRILSVSIENNWWRLISEVSRETAIYLESNGWTILFSNNISPVIRLRDTSAQIFHNQLEREYL